jgi:hypothetical protein
MPLPSLYISEDKPREWRVSRGAAYDAVLGIVAGLLKTLGFTHQAMATSLPEIAGAALCFALLCAGATALRNFIARRLIWPELQ